MLSWKNKLERVQQIFKRYIKYPYSRIKQAEIGDLRFFDADLFNYNNMKAFVKQISDLDIYEECIMYHEYYDAYWMTVTLLK